MDSSQSDITQAKQSDVMRLDLLPESLETFTQRMQRYLHIGLSIISAEAPRLNENERLYENIPDEKEINDRTIAQLEVPLVRAMVDTMAAHVVNVINAHQPKLAAVSKGLSDAQASDLQDLYEYVLLLSDYPNWFRRALIMAGIQNGAFVRVEWEQHPIEKSRCIVRNFDARQVIVLPNTPGNIWDKKLVMARQVLTREELAIMMNRGTFRRVESLLGSESTKSLPSLSADLQVDRIFGDVEGESPDINTVAIWDGIIRLPVGDDVKKTRRKARQEPGNTDSEATLVYSDTGLYVVTIEENTGAILRFQRYPYRIHPWAYLAFCPSPIHFRSTTGMTTLLQPIQHHLSALLDVAIDAAAMEARPPIFVRGGMRGPTATTEYGPGDIVDLDGDVVPLAVHGSTASLLNGLAILWDNAQRLVHLTDLDLGQSLRGAETLGEAQMVQARSGASFDQNYVEPAAVFLERVALVMREVLSDRANWDQFVEDHDAALPEDLSPADLLTPHRITAMSRSLRNLPAMRLQEIQKALDVFSLGPLAIFADQYQLAKEFAQTLQIPRREKLLVPPEKAQEIQEQIASQATAPEEQVPPEALEEMQMGMNGGTTG